MNTKHLQGGLMAFHPGYYLTDLLEDANTTPAQFAEKTGIDLPTLEGILWGEDRVTFDIAEKFSSALGSSVALWLNLQKAWDDDTTGKEVTL